MQQAAYPPSGHPLPDQGSYGGPPMQGGPPVGSGGPVPGGPQGMPVSQQGMEQQMDDDAPPPVDMNDFKTYNGYEMVGGFGQMNSVAPPPPPPPPSGEAPHMAFQDVANLKDEECREALLNLVDEECCWGKKAAQDMKITNIQGSTALHYVLETFCEGRNTNYEHVPFYGQLIDGPENGMPPPPWAIEVHPDQHFVNHEKRLEVPHTATVKPCHHCLAIGTIMCRRCNGNGRVRCTMCHGSGTRSRYDPHEKRHVRERCFSCGGDGMKRCITCGGDGRIRCPTCQGHRQLKCYILLTVRFVNHIEDYILEKTGLPDELIRGVSGNLIFEQTMFQVWPISAYPTPEINHNSIRLVEKHRTAFAYERHLQQRHNLRAVPVTACSYEWKDTKTQFWVYGLDRKAHAPDYPQQCCWGCEIL